MLGHTYKTGEPWAVLRDGSVPFVLTGRHPASVGGMDTGNMKQHPAQREQGAAGRRHGRDHVTHTAQLIRKGARHLHNEKETAAYLSIRQAA